MNIFNTKKSRNTESADRSRRSFIWLGAGASAAVASTALASAAESGKAGTGKTDDLSLRVALLEEEKVLRKFHQQFEQAMDQARHEAVIGMFADDAEVIFNGGAFRNRAGVSRLFREHFAAGKTGVRMQAAPGFELSAGQQQERVEISADLRTATAVFPYSIQVGTPIETESSLAAMARLHGEGVRTWWEGGVYQVSYRRDAANSNASWKIDRLEYTTLSQADYRPGKRYAQPITVARLSTRFPVDERGPDDLV
ncbi:MAG: nuclear transport factor 2 family protein [Pseudomonadota bacterium]